MKNNNWINYLAVLVLGAVIGCYLFPGNARADGINCQQFKTLIIRPALISMGGHYDSPQAENLLLMIASTESHMGTYLKQGHKSLADGKGRAVGIYGMERATFNDTMKRSKLFHHSWFYLKYRTKFERLIYDLRFATIVARAKLALVPQPIPQDREAMAYYYAIYWQRGNNRQGVALNALGNYDRLCGRVK